MSLSRAINAHLFVLLISISFLAQAQKEASVWYFGQNAGVDFNSGSPIALTNGQLSTSEGSASISSRDGRLLFYSDGITIYDSTHSVMLNGTGLMGHPSSAQSGIIIPKPSSLTIYYLFTVNYSGSSATGLRYTEIDMTLNSGLGAVTANKNIYLGGPASEKLAAVKHSNNVDYWVIIKKTGTNQFNAFLISCNGVNLTPVVSSTGLVTTTWGYLTASPDGNRLAMAESGPGFEVYDYDNSNGIVSNPINLGNGGAAYGVSFSPDNNLLYGLRIVGGEMYQWNLLAGGIAAIQASRVVLGNAPGTAAPYRGGAMQIGPDGKIYIPDFRLASLSEISNPNVIGTGCNFQASTVNLSGRNAVLGLPPFASGFFSPNFSWSNTCHKDRTIFGISGDTAIIDSVKWLFGDPLSGNNFSTNFSSEHSFSGPGQYEVKLITYVSCAIDTSMDTVLVRPPDTTHQFIRICQYDSFFAETAWQFNPGVYTDSFINQYGCDSVWITNLSVDSIPFTQISPEICQGDSFTFNNVAYFSSGVYTDTLKGVNLCDSITSCILTVNPTYYIIRPIRICQGDSLLAGGQYQNSSGNYIDNYKTINNCDSIIETQLTVDPTYLINWPIIICNGESHLAGGQLQTLAGTYYDTLNTTQSCDSVIQTVLTVNPTYVDTQFIEICQGDSFLAGGSQQQSPGIYLDTLQTINTCDSIIITSLSVNPVYLVPIFPIICADDSFFAAGQWQKSSGTYYDSLFTFKNCDSVIQINLTVNPVYHFTIDTAICQGENYYTGVQWISSTGIFYDSLLTINSCDSVIETNLTVKPVPLTLIDTSICFGDSYLAGGIQQFLAGTFYDTLTASNLCDSIVETILRIKPIRYDSLYFDICQGDSLFVGGSWQFSSGSYNDTFVSSLQCDSVLSSIITVHPHKMTPQIYSICEGESFFVAGAWQTTSGVYYDTLFTSFNCDSVISTDLVVYPVYDVFIDTFVCEGDAHYAGGDFQFAPGTYIDSLKSISACDSIITTLLFVSDPLVDLGDDQIICEGDSFELDAGYFVNYLWQDASSSPVLMVNTAGEYSVIVWDEYGCSDTDSILAEHLCEAILYVPNVFTPNSDGTNDYFRVHGSDILEFHLTIHDRWGELLFESTDINETWDGTDNGTLVPNGPYVWVVSYNSYDGSALVHRNEAGTVTVVR